MAPTKESETAEIQRTKIEKKLSAIYTPGEPIKEPELFSGRTALLESLRQELAIPGKHFVLYGERGSGKTSFYNVLLHRRPFKRHTCTKKDDFITIFLNILGALGEDLTEAERGILEKAGYTVGTDGLKVEAGLQLERKFVPLASQKLDPAQVAKRFQKVQKHLDAIVLDEFQNLTNPEIQTQVIEVVKTLADNNIGVRIFCVGTASSDSDLLKSPEYPQYKMRHFTAAQIPLMNADELEDIIDKRQNIFNIRFDQNVKKSIADIASGYPANAHTIALYSCFAWLTSEAGQLFVRSWVESIPILGAVAKAIFKWKEQKIEKLDMEVKKNELVGALGYYLHDFGRNYRQEAAQYRAGLGSPDADVFQNVLVRLASNGAETSGSAVAAAINIAEPNLRKLITKRMNMLVQSHGKASLRFSFPQLRSMVRTVQYLWVHSPTAFSKFLGSAGGPPTPNLTTGNKDA